MQPRYHIIRTIGGGGMGRVYEAIDTELGERIALKTLHPNAPAESVARFRCEAKLTRRIHHTNVVRMFDIGQCDDQYILTMELVDGESLAREQSPIPWPRLTSLAAQLCDGLAAAHDAGVVHRDLKPDNVLIERRTDRAVITDFGIAHDASSPEHAGIVVGTPSYMSPEQLRGLAVDPRSDLFSLGVMLFELVTGERPWRGDRVTAVVTAQATCAPRTVPHGSIPRPFAAIIEDCLQLDPARRPKSAAAVRAALAACDTLDQSITWFRSRRQSSAAAITKKLDPTHEDDPCIEPPTRIDIRAA